MAKSDFKLDLDDERLWRDDEQIPISNKAFQLLKLFTEKPDRLVSKEEILEGLWGDSFVTDGLVREYVHDLRQALNDDPRSPRFIETVPRKGYRFLGGIAVAGSTIPVVHPCVYVEPFGDLSGTDRGALLARGLTDDVVTDLTRNPDVSVVVGSPAKEASGYSLGGTVQLSESHVRINVRLSQLIDRQHVWADRYDAPIGDFLDMQQEIAARVSAALGSSSGPLSQAEVDRMKRKLPSNLEVWELTRLAFDLETQFNRAQTKRAEELIERALSIDPSFARAWLVLGWICWQQAMEGWTEDPDALREKSRVAYERAAELDPGDPIAQMEMAAARAVWREPSAAAAALERALAIGAYQPDVQISCANYVASLLDDPARAQEILASSLSLLPRVSRFQALTVLRVSVFAGDFAAANTAAYDAPDFLQTRLFKALAVLGEGRDPKKSVREVLERCPRFDPVTYLDDHPITGQRVSKDFLGLCRKAGLS